MTCRSIESCGSCGHDLLYYVIFLKFPKFVTCHNIWVWKTCCSMWSKWSNLHDLLDFTWVWQLTSTDHPTPMVYQQNAVVLAIFAALFPKGMQASMPCGDMDTDHQVFHLFLDEGALLWVLLQSPCSCASRRSRRSQFRVCLGTVKDHQLLVNLVVVECHWTGPGCPNHLIVEVPICPKPQKHQMQHHLLGWAQCTVVNNAMSVMVCQIK